MVRHTEQWKAATNGFDRKPAIVGKRNGKPFPVAVFETAADRDLALAAPDMLAALEWLRANYASGPTTEINRRIDEAVAKAKGDDHA